MAEQHADRQLARILSVQRLLEELARLACGERHQKEALRITLVQDLRGADEDVGQVAHFGLPAARQHRHHAALGRYAEAFARLGTIGFEREFVGERVADVAHRHAGALVKLGLEGEQAQHVRHRARDALDPPAPPGPDRRADEVDRGDAGVAHLALEPQVEVGRIHTDEGVGALGADLPEQVAADAGELAVALERVDVAMHREQLAGPAHLEAFGLHLRPADAEELGVGQVAAQRADQVAREQVAGGLPGDHGDADLHVLGNAIRVMLSARCRDRSRR